MMYILASCEKLNTGLYAHESHIISHKLDFFSSHGALVFGIFSVVAPLIHIGIRYEAGNFLWNNPLNILLFALVLLGVWLINQGRAGIEERKEHGGIHPADTLIIFDADHKTVTKRKKTSEELLTTFADMQLNIRVDRSSKQIKYRIDMKYPKGTERITSTGNRTRAEEVLQSIKTHLNIV